MPFPSGFTNGGGLDSVFSGFRVFGSGGKKVSERVKSRFFRLLLESFMFKQCYVMLCYVMLCC